MGGSERPHNARLRLNDPQTRQVLFEAVDSGDATLAEQLPRAGADQDMRGSSGFEPLEQAAQNGDLAVVRLLLQYPVDDSILLVAVEDGTFWGKWNDDLIRLLISQGLSVSFPALVSTAATAMTRNSTGGGIHSWGSWQGASTISQIRARSPWGSRSDRSPGRLQARLGRASSCSPAAARTQKLRLSSMAR